MANVYLYCNDADIVPNILGGTYAPRCTSDWQTITQEQLLQSQMISLSQDDYVILQGAAIMMLIIAFGVRMIVKLLIQPPRG